MKELREIATDFYRELFNVTECDSSRVKELHELSAAVHQLSTGRVPGFHAFLQY